MKTFFTLSILALSQLCFGQKLIGKWGFDNSSYTIDTGQGSIAAEGGAAFTSFVAGNPSTGKSFGTNTYPAQSQSNEKAGIRIKFSTQGYKDISFSFEQYNSNTASKKTMIFASADGNSFTKVDSLIIAAGSAWFTKTIDLKSFTSLNNKSEIHILLVSSFIGTQYVATGSTSTYGTAGTWRFDNIRFWGTEDKAPSIKPKLNISSNKSSLSESKSDTATITFTLSDTAFVNLKNKITFTGTGIGSGDYMWLGTDTINIPKGNLSATLQLKIKDDTEVESLETGDISIINLDTNVTKGTSLKISLVDDDMQSTLIWAVQGKGAASVMVNSTVAVEGVVIADLQGTNEQGGYYIQDKNPDTDPETSEGIFIKDLTFNVAEGDLVKVTGKVLEEFGQTILTQVSSVNILSKNNTVQVVNIQFPLDSVNVYERYEGMKIKITQQLTVTENYQLGRYGEITASVNGRLFNPSNSIDPNDNSKEGNTFSGRSNVSVLLAQQSLNNRSKILICDKLSIQNPNPVPFIDPIEKTLRSGSTIDTLTGVLGYGFSFYRVYPAGGQLKINYATRPAAPTITGANVKVVGMNVLNYFNGDGMGGGFPTPRGAATLPEFVRQKAKIVAAIKALDADVLGLMEMEHDGDSTSSAIKDLVTSINSAYGSTVYDYIRDSKGTNGNPGTDAIKVALIYKPSVLTPFGPSKSHNDASFSLLGRPPLAQTFTLKSNSEKFTVIVNHFKSKSCAASPADPLDLDQLDGQGCFNATRKKQSAALLTFISTLVQQTNDSDIVSIGDYNSYGEEDPLDILKAASLKSLAGETYSYVFDAQTGSLDHGFATPSMFKQMTSATKWHVNCDEPLIIDYTLTFKTQDLYSPIAYRSSDHDPLIAGFNLVKKAPIGIETSKNFGFKIYPNPNNGNFTIDIKNLGTSSLSIYNVTGKLIYSNDALQGISEIKAELNSGLYFIVIESLGKKVTDKLIIR